MKEIFEIILKLGEFFITPCGMHCGDDHRENFKKILEILAEMAGEVENSADLDMSCCEDCHFKEPEE